MHRSAGTSVNGAGRLELAWQSLPGINRYNGQEIRQYAKELHEYQQNS